MLLVAYDGASTSHGDAVSGIDQCFLGRRVPQPSAWADVATCDNNATTGEGWCYKEEPTVVEGHCWRSRKFVFRYYNRINGLL
jgi:hypothetical protein